MKRWSVVALAVLACGGTASTDRRPAAPLAPAPSPPAFPALARADLVATLASGELAAYSIAGDKLTELGRLALASAAEVSASPDWGFSLAWLDGDRLLVNGVADALVIAPAGQIRLALPGDAAFAAIPSPKDHDGELTEGTGGWLVREGSRAFWAHCAWGFAVDGFQCVSYARIQVWPPDAAARVEVWQPDSAGEAPRAVWTEAPPAFALGTTDDNIPTCQDHGRTVTLGTEGQHSYELHWLGSKPAALLVVYGEYGLADAIPVGFAVFDRCSERPVLVGRGYELFSDGLWLSEDAAPGADPTYATHLRRNLTVLGEVPAHRSIAMRPRNRESH